MKSANKKPTCLLTLVLVFVLGACGVGSVRAAENSQATSVSSADFADSVSLSLLVRLALENNAQLQAAHANWRVAVEDASFAGTLPDPVLSYSYYIQEVETRVGAQRQVFSISQAFPWFGKLRLRNRAASFKAEAAWREMEIQRQKLVFSLRRLVADYWFLKRNIDITSQNIALLSSVEKIVNERYRTGRDMSALVRVQVQIGKMTDRFESLKELRPALAARINAAVGREADAPLAWPKNLAGDEAVGEIDFSDLKGRIRERSPELLKMETEILRQDALVGLARKNGFPDIVFGIKVIDTDEALSPSTPDSGKDPVMATVSVALPLWRSKYRGETRSAQLMRDAVLMNKNDRELEITALARQAFYDFNDSARRMELYSNTLIPKAREAMALTQEGFVSGKAGFDAVLDAERELLEFELAAERARADRFGAWAQLMFLVGDDAVDEPVILKGEE